MTAGPAQDESIGNLLRAGTERLVCASPSPRLDAELLLMEATGLDRAALIVRSDRKPAAAAVRAFFELVAARAAGQPIAYLLGRREFWSLSLRVDPHTLIPRPETELLVETALALLGDRSAARVADLGTGAGTVALALARERPPLDITATDRSAPALAVARENAAGCGVRNVRFVLGDWFAPLGTDRYDLIVSNPPYVAAGDPHLREGDLRFEPRDALVGGSDGLEALRHIVSQAANHLLSGGWLAVEHGHDQGAAVRALFVDHGFRAIATRTDLAGLERVSYGCTMTAHGA